MTSSASKQSANQSAIAALTYALVPNADGVTVEAHLLPPGPFRATDGRPFECDAWQLDASIAQKLIALSASRKTDLVICYEHQDIRSKDNGKPAPAAGWIPNSLEWREGRGLFGTNITWTTVARDEIASKQYRYISTVFWYDRDSGEVLEILSVALTNTPGLDGLDALAALVRGADLPNHVSLTKGVDDMADEKQLVALTVERDGLNVKVAALSADLDKSKASLAELTKTNTELSGKVAGFEQEKATAALAADKVKHGELLLAALTDGRLVPAQKPWAEKQSLVALTEYLGATGPLAMLNKQTNKDNVSGDHGLTADELAMCSRMSVTPEDYAKTKAKK